MRRIAAAFRAEDEAQTRDPQLGRLMLYQLSYFRKNTAPWRASSFDFGASGIRLYSQKRTASETAPLFRAPRRRFAEICSSNRFFKWEVMDSNHRRRTPADLQSAPFDRSGNFPCLPPLQGGRRSAEDFRTSAGVLSRSFRTAPSSSISALRLAPLSPGPLVSHRLSEPMEGFEPPTS